MCFQIKLILLLILLMFCYATIENVHYLDFEVECQYDKRETFWSLIWEFYFNISCVQFKNKKYWQSTFISIKSLLKYHAYRSVSSKLKAFCRILKDYFILRIAFFYFDMKYYLIHSKPCETLFHLVKKEKKKIINFLI